VPAAVRVDAAVSVAAPLTATVPADVRLEPAGSVAPAVTVGVTATSNGVTRRRRPVNPLPKRAI
jgi:hypothetical protein